MISTLNMSRNEWLKLRKTGLGGSDAGAICGLNPYSSPMKVYQDKTSEDVSDLDNDASGPGPGGLRCPSFHGGYGAVGPPL